MYRILIVDDEPMALYSTAHTFPWADWGFDPPVLMTEAPAALDNLRTERFDARDCGHSDAADDGH